MRCSYFMSCKDCIRSNCTLPYAELPALSISAPWQMSWKGKRNLRQFQIVSTSKPAGLELELKTQSISLLNGATRKPDSDPGAPQLYLQQADKELYSFGLSFRSCYLYWRFWHFLFLFFFGAVSGYGTTVGCTDLTTTINVFATSGNSSQLPQELARLRGPRRHGSLWVTSRRGLSASIVRAHACRHKHLL